MYRHLSPITIEQAVLENGMEISPIREIRAVGAASAPKAESEIEPPFALNLVARMDDDAYHSSSHAPEPGLEEEDQEQAEEGDDQSAMLSGASNSESEVDFLA